MSLFKENLLKKITINRLFSIVLRSIDSLNSYGKIDIEAMRELLVYSSWFYVERRDLSLYLDGDEESYRQVLVLDNDLIIYNTTIQDVLIRKSPNLKEMINFKNVIKILSDKDVVVCKKRRTLEVIRDLCVDALELSFSESDVDQIILRGEASLNDQHHGGVEEAIKLLSEILNFVSSPKAFLIEHNKIWGFMNRQSNGGYVFGPMVIYSTIDNSIFYVENVFKSLDKGKIDKLKAVLSGDREGLLATGSAVFHIMKKNIMCNLDSKY